MRHPTPVALSVGLGLCLAPAVALASDFSGMFTILIGLPSLAIANLVMGLLFSDAASLFRHSRDTVTGAVFFGLYALACLLFVLHMQRGVPPSPSQPPPPGG